MAPPNLTPQNILLPAGTAANVSTDFQFVGPVFVSNQKWELLNKINASGQLSISGKFTRTQLITASGTVPIELTFYNHHSTSLKEVKMGKKVNVGV